MATKTKKTKSVTPAEQPKTVAVHSFAQLVSVPMPPTLTPTEMLQRGEDIMQEARKHPDKLARFIHNLVIVGNSKVVGRKAPLGNWPTDPDQIDTYRTQLIARAAVVADKPENSEDCFAMKLLAQAAERAGIPLPVHCSAKVLGEDGATRMRTLRGQPLLF